MGREVLFFKESFEPDALCVPCECFSEEKVLEFVKFEYPHRDFSKKSVTFYLRFGIVSGSKVKRPEAHVFAQFFILNMYFLPLVSSASADQASRFFSNRNMATTMPHLDQNVLQCTLPLWSVFISDGLMNTYYFRSCSSWY